MKDRTLIVGVVACLAVALCAHALSVFAFIMASR